MIKASSMAYAIFIFVIVGICCYAFILLSSVSQLHQTILSSQRELVSTNESANIYFLNKVETLSHVKHQEDVLKNGMMSEAYISNWGAFKVLQTLTYFKTDTIKRMTLIGQHQRQKPALYLPNNGKILHLADKASIRGDILVPNGELKVGYLISNAYKKLNFKSGSIMSSGLRLPKLKFEYNQSKEPSHRVNLDTMDASVPIYNPFDKETMICYTSRNQLSAFDLKGNIKIVAKDSLFIRNSCILEDVLIDAPKVVFEQNFEGKVQIFAKEHVSLQQGAQLLYPSSIYISNNNNAKIVMHMAERTKVIGGIVIDDEEYVGNTLRLMTIDKGAEVIGDVYCNGSIDLKGTITGSVYTDRFYLKTSASTYENYIQDGTINGEGLPDYFVGLPLFSKVSTKNANYEIIKTL